MSDINGQLLGTDFAMPSAYHAAIHNGPETSKHGRLCEVHSLEQGLKARVGAVGVEERFVR